jgi:uncharacterized membrane protein YfcA
MLEILFGIIVGVSLGLTGGGGSILAVPLLVHGLGMDAKLAAGVSLAAVGATALIGALERMSRREIDVAAGVMFAIIGMAGAPLGVIVRKHTPPVVLLLLFSLLMIVVAARMWRRAGGSAVDEPRQSPSQSRWGLLVGLGLGAGFLSGLFGVGGGFIIVPALVLVSGMEIHRAVATSLLVIPLVSFSGVLSQVVARDPLDWHVTALFVGGGIVGMFAGTAACRKLSPRGLQVTFAAVIMLVAVFNAAATLFWHR